MQRSMPKELKAQTKEALLAHELFSAMTPWETVKSLLSLLVESQILKNSWKKKESSTLFVPTSCRKLTETCTSSLWSVPWHQE